MFRIGVVGCTGKLGSMIMNNILNSDEAELTAAVAKPGNPKVGFDVSYVIGGQNRNIIITDSITASTQSDVFIDCTGAESFIYNNLNQYRIMKKPLVIGTTGFSKEDEAKIWLLAEVIPVFISGNFSKVLHDFIETLKFAVKRISDDTDIHIMEYHHKQKKDAPSGTAIMIRDALIRADSRLTEKDINISSVRAGNMNGEHHVIFANNKDEITEYIHRVSSRETFSTGAIHAAGWIINRNNGLYSMDDLYK